MTFYTCDLHDYIIEWDKSNGICNYNDVISDEVTIYKKKMSILFKLFVYWRKYIILNGGGCYIPHVLEWQGTLNEYKEQNATSKCYKNYHVQWDKRPMKVL